jgi:hypothetical protein
VLSRVELLSDLSRVYVYESVLVLALVLVLGLVFGTAFLLRTVGTRRGTGAAAGMI